MTTLDAYTWFLTARWDEQEDAARTATVEVSIHRRWSAVDGQAPVEAAPWVEVFTPAYVLADLAAKRAALRGASTARDCAADSSATGAYMTVARLLADPFRDHPANQEHL